MRRDVSSRRRILFLTGTRADFGKLRGLMASAERLVDIDVTVFVTGMHMLKQYGSTWEEVEAANIGRAFMFVNQKPGDGMDSILAKTVSGLSDLVREIEPELIVVHGDRLEALAGALVGTLNRIPVAHVEGGELSGTVDETIRHSITKLSHVHLVANKEAQRRLLQLGEIAESIFVIGSPEVDVMTSSDLPTLDEVKRYYEIEFDRYIILSFHPVTTEFNDLGRQANELVNFVLESRENFVVIRPNNDDGTEIVQNQFRRFEGVENIRMIPSMRFHYYLTALKNAELVLGNSSSGVREAPFFGIPTVDIGTRQNRRTNVESVISVQCVKSEIEAGVSRALQMSCSPSAHFGDGRSSERFVKLLQEGTLWRASTQKMFVDRGVYVQGSE